jgi:hypothetical protein
VLTQTFDEHYPDRVGSRKMGPLLALLRHISLSIRREMDLVAKGENSDGLGEASR